MERTLGQRPLNRAQRDERRPEKFVDFVTTQAEKERQAINLVEFGANQFVSC